MRLQLSTLTARRVGLEKAWPLDDLSRHGENPFLPAAPAVPWRLGWAVRTGERESVGFTWQHPTQSSVRQGLAMHKTAISEPAVRRRKPRPRGVLLATRRPGARRDGA